MMVTRCTSMSILLAAMLITASSAYAARTPLYIAAHYRTQRPIPRAERHDFTAVIGHPAQQVSGVAFWRYVKGSRTPISTLPEDWYIHSGGHRVHDERFGYYVMNPSRLGWQRYVANRCRPRCFLDGMGVTSLSRTRPRISWTAGAWVRAASSLIAYAHTHGSAVLPNSIHTRPGLEREYLHASGGRGSVENVGMAILHLGHIWVQADGGDCLAQWHAYVAATDGNDHFSCHPTGRPPWDDSWWDGSYA